VNLQNVVNDSSGSKKQIQLDIHDRGPTIHEKTIKTNMTAVVYGVPQNYAVVYGVPQNYVLPLLK
jgi:hypothetical protein